MNRVACCFLFCGILTCIVSAVPSPQWVYEQIHALSDDLAPETHAKKSKIPYGKDEKKELVHKRKDGVKKLFKFLDAAVEQRDSSGGGDSNIPDGSGLEQAGFSNEQHSASTHLSPQKPKDAEEPKQANFQDLGSLDKRNRTGFRTQQGTSETNSMVRDKARLTGYQQQNETKTASSTGAGFTSSAQASRSFNQPSTQGITFSTTQSALQLSYPERQRLPYSSSVSPYSKPVQGQHFSSSYQAVAQQRHSSGLITSYRRPPAVPVHSKVSENQPAGPHFLRAAQRVLGAPHRSSIQSPLYTSMTAASSYPYETYYISQHGFPDTNGKSAGPPQEGPYGQPRRQREQFHQQTRTHIPGRAALTTVQRFPVSRFPSQSRSAIQDHLSYKQVTTSFGSRARVPIIQRPLMSSQYAGANLAQQAYYRSAIRQQQPAFARTAPAQIQGYDYPLLQQTRLARAVMSRKPHPRTILTPLTVAVARPAVPSQPQTPGETYAGATTKPVWSTSTVRSGTHPDDDD